MAERQSLIEQKRAEYHAGLVASGTLSIDASGVASIADKGNKLSKAVALSLAQALNVETQQERAAGQTMGGSFEAATADFIEQTFPAFHMLRPGRWHVYRVGNKGAGSIADFEPYTHLAALAAAIEKDPTLVSVLGNAYAISPDIVVSREPESDILINEDERLVDAKHATNAAIRLVNQQNEILHAVLSCKWTLRSDRAQNARSEALNLIRNRKGRLPHVVVVTAEPTPSRLSSLALGTGDLDCVYHVALPELVAAMHEHGNDDNNELLQTMVAGNRLKDISDLPLDLTV